MENRNIQVSMWAGIIQAGVQAVHSRRNTNKQQFQWEQDHYRAIQDRVADAKLAGIHPLYAIGAQGASGGSKVSGQQIQGADIASAIQRDRQLKQQQKESESRIALNKAREEDIIQKNKNTSDAAVIGQGMQNDDTYVSPGGKRYKAGTGTSAQRLEDQYGQITEGESAYRYLRDRDFFNASPKNKKPSSHYYSRKKWEKMKGYRNKIYRDRLGYPYRKNKYGTRSYIR